MFNRMLTISQTWFFYITIIVISLTLFWAGIAYCERQNIRIKGLGSKEHTIAGPRTTFVLMISFFVLVVPLLFRNCGADLQNYYRSYSVSNIESFDQGFFVLCSALRSFVSDPQIGIGIIGSLSIVLMYVATKQCVDKINKINIVYIYILYVYFNSYNYVKMGIAASIILLGYIYLQNKNMIKGMLSILIAGLFHNSAFIVFGLYFVVIYLRKHRYLLILLFLILGFVLYRYPSVIFNVVSNERYLHYVSEMKTTTAAFGIGTVLKVLPYIVITVYLKKRFTDMYYYNMFLASEIMNFICSIPGYYIGTFSRISNMYLLFHCYSFVPYVLKNINLSKSERMMIALFGVLWPLIIFGIQVSNFEIIGIVPYY